MTVKEKLIEYYLPWFIALTIFLGLRFGIVMLDEKERSVEAIIWFFSILIVMTAIGGSIKQWFEEIYKPKRLAKLFDKIKDLDLQDMGLKANNEKKNFTGYYDGFFLTLFVESTLTQGEWIKANAFIATNPLPKDVYTQLQKKYELNLGSGLVWFASKTKMKFGKSPKIETLKKDIRELIASLRSKNIEPQVFVKS